MGQVTGTVYKIFENQLKSGRDSGKTSFSIKLEGDDTYYGTYINRPSCAAGDNVAFEAVTKGNFTNVDIKTLRVTGGSPQQSSAPNTNKPAGGAGGGRDEYWKNKEAYDKEVTQPHLNYRSATMAAIDIGRVALEKDIIPLGSKKADKFDIFMELIRKTRNEIYLDYEDAASKLKEGKPIVNREAVELAESAQEAKENPAVDEWADASDSSIPF